MAVRKVCSRAPTATPRPLIQVRKTMLRIATSRCTDTPSGMASAEPGRRMWPSERKIVSLSDGKKTARYLAIATATAAMVPVWITVKRVQPKRNPTAGESPSRRKTYWPPAFGIIAASSA